MINQRRLRLTGTGITTPDTVLPDTEAILRDYADGQEWLRSHGMMVQPRLAYLPDDFGHSPALPTMLVALGFDMVAVTRIDGMYFVGCDYRGKSCFPLPGSSADVLVRELQTADFVWRGPDGSQVLCHWNPFTYFQGDLLASIGVFRWMDWLYGLPWPTEAHVTRRIRGYCARAVAVVAHALALLSDWGRLQRVGFVPREMAFEVLPLLSHPATGTDPHEGQLDYAVWFTPRVDAWENRLPHHVRRALRAAMFGPHEPDLDDLANSVVMLDRDDVQVTALKPAFRGDGVVVRLASFAKQAVVVALACTMAALAHDR